MNTPMTYDSVEGLEVLVLPPLARVLAEMTTAGVADPVGALRRLQGGDGTDEPALQPYAKVFDHLRGLYGLRGVDGYRDNAQILEMAMRQAVALAASLR